ncbi:MAG: hypothetical protein ACE14S_01105 [Candidatus Bathyarchaeia archaeon]
MEALRESSFGRIETLECIMRGRQMERGKTRLQTLTMGHAGYTTHARKVIKPVLENAETTEQGQPVSTE